MGKWVVALMVGVALLVGHARVHASELNLMGYFENPWKNPKKEARAIIERRWAVSTDTWEAVYHPRDTIVPKSLSQFLGIIQRQKPNSIQRINLFSHGNRGIIAFTGDIDPTTGGITLDTKTALALRIDDLEYRSKEGGLKEESLGMIARGLRNRFHKGAEIVFYTCNSGVDWELLQAIADAFQVVVRGFKGPILFCPQVKKKALGYPPIPIGTWDPSFTSLDPRCREPK